MIDSAEVAFRTVAQFVALGIETVAILLVALGAVQAAAGSLETTFRQSPTALTLRAVWIRFAGWILMALEFALGADVIRTAIAPTWDDLGKLGTIAVIRTGLSYFLERDMEEARELKPARSPKSGS